MATSYDEVTDSTGSQTLPAADYSVSGGGCAPGILTIGAITAFAPPNGGTRTYEPIVRRLSTSDPSKGSKRNWQAIKRSGEISMTPYSRSSTVDEYFVVSREFRNVDWRRKTGTCRAVEQPVCTFDGGPEIVKATWTQNDDFHSLSDVFLHSRVYSQWADLQSQIADAISTTQQAAFAEALSTYDILTEIMESKETLRYLSSKVGEVAESLRKFAHADEPTHKRARAMTAKQLFGHADKAFRRYGSRWMEYRYAIMPLLYSVKDIRDVMANRDAVYKSGRSRVTIDIDMDSKITSDYQTYERVFGKVEIRSLTKVGYDSGALQRVASQIKFNPFTTAWELVPLSFVVDWLLNIGDAINSATALDFSSQRKGCTSVKRSHVGEINLWDSRDLTVHKTLKHDLCGDITVSDTHRMNVDALLMRRTIESYDRFLYDRPAPKVVFDPFLSWKRVLDAIVLGYQPTKKLLRSL